MDVIGDAQMIISVEVFGEAIEDSIEITAKPLFRVLSKLFS